MTNHKDYVFEFPLEGYHVYLKENDRGVAGVVQFPQGIVEIESYSGGNGNGVTRMEFVANGLVYRRMWKRYYTWQYLVTLAKQFVADALLNGEADVVKK